MGARTGNPELDQIEEIEQAARKFQSGGTLPSGRALQEIALCKERCKAARSSLASNEIGTARRQSFQASLYLRRALEAQNSFDDLRDKIAAKLVATLPEARRRVVKRLYPNLSGKSKRRAGRG